MRDANPFRIVPHVVRSYLTPSTSLQVVDLLERILYPNDGYPGLSPADLTPEEAKMVRGEVESRLKQIIPGQSALKSIRKRS
jgi:hypothetical protein